jgi:hypothetical protein
MSWNVWKHVRLIGAVLCIVAAFIHRLELTFIGFAAMFMGTVGAVDRLERIIQAFLEEKDKSNDETQA